MLSYDFIIANIPHASVEIPDFADFLPSETAVRREARLIADLYTDELIDDGPAVRRVVAPVSRLYVDTERFADDEKEPAARFGMGVLYTKTHDGVHLRLPPSPERRAELIGRYYDPHHAALTDAVDESLTQTGKALILDLHSYPTRFDFLGTKGKYAPDVCIGCDAFHADIAVLEKLVNWCYENGFSCAVNNPFSGAVVPSKHYGKTKEVASFMIEIRRGLYMNEETFEKRETFSVLKREIGRLLRSLTR